MHMLFDAPGLRLLASASPPAEPTTAGAGFDPSLAWQLPAPAAAGLLAAVGLLFWTSGGRTIRPAVVAAGLCFGALLGWRFGGEGGPLAGVVARLALPPVAVAGAGGVVGVVLATMLHRLTIALGLGVVLAAAAGGFVFVAGPVPGLEDAVEAAPAALANAGDDAAAERGVRTLAEALGLPPGAEAALLPRVAPTLDDAERRLRGAAAAAEDWAFAGADGAEEADPAAADAAGSFEARRRSALLAAGIGLAAGTLLGVFVPVAAAVLVTATAGAGLLLAAGRLLAPGFVPAPGEHGAPVVLVAWAVLALMGAAMQARSMPSRRGDPAREPAPA